MEITRKQLEEYWKMYGLTVGNRLAEELTIMEYKELFTYDLYKTQPFGVVHGLAKILGEAYEESISRRGVYGVYMETLEDRRVKIYSKDKSEVDEAEWLSSLFKDYNKLGEDREFNLKLEEFKRYYVNEALEEIYRVEREDSNYWYVSGIVESLASMIAHIYPSFKNIQKRRLFGYQREATYKYIKNYIEKKVTEAGEDREFVIDISTKLLNYIDERVEVRLG